MCSIEVYRLANGKYSLDGIYQLANDSMVDQDKEACTDAIPVSLYNGFSIPLEEIFYNLF